MKPITPQIRPPFKTPGGKYYLAYKLIKLFPDHETYVEPFLGGGNTLLNKPKSRVEIACDLNPDIINVWKTIRDHGYSLQEELLNWTCEEYCFNLACNILENKDNEYPEASQNDFVRATAYIVRNRFSRCGFGEKWCHSKRYRGGSPEQVNSWKTFVNNALPRIGERIQEVKFYNEDFRNSLRVAKSFADDPSTLIYCDPPYMKETRTVKNTYGKYEMSDQDHKDLLEILLDCEAKVFISGYWSSLYGEKLYNWKFRSWDIPNHSSQKIMKGRRVECLWENL